MFLWKSHLIIGLSLFVRFIRGSSEVLGPFCGPKLNGSIYSVHLNRITPLLIVKIWDQLVPYKTFFLNRFYLVLAGIAKTQPSYAYVEIFKLVLTLIATWEVRKNIFLAVSLGVLIFEGWRNLQLEFAATARCTPLILISHDAETCNTMNHLRITKNHLGIS